MTNTLTSSGLLLLAILLLNTDVRAQGSTGNQQMSRAEALRVLKGCANRPITLGCSEDTAGYLIDLYDHGDHLVLKPLLDAGLSSDGALTEILGTFYSDVLWKHPRTFLGSLSSRPSKQQRYLCNLTGGTDGSGMPPGALKDVRRALARIMSQDQDRLSRVARICLTEVNRTNPRATRR